MKAGTTSQSTALLGTEPLPHTKMPTPRSPRLLVGAALLAVAVGRSADSARADTPWQLERTTLLPGVEIVRMERTQPPLVVHTARVSPDAAVELRPVLASDAVGDDAGGHETTSSMCDRADGIVCVNADFNACPGCREPFGGVVRDGRVVRSFNGHHEQLSMGQRGPMIERIQWSGVLRASYAWEQRHEPATSVPVASVRSSASSVELAGLNVRLQGDEVVAYTDAWAPTAPAPSGATHLSLVLSGPLVPGSLSVVSAERANMSPIPPNGVVIVASGAAAERLDRFWQEWAVSDADERALVIESAMSQPVETSVGGHPVLLRGGEVLELNQRDPKVRDRHPRTLAGWTATGELFLLTVDGRQPGYSEGLTLVEAQDLLLSLGAVGGINLDGGGSSTFVAPCAAGRCVRNRPSDGRERRVTSALAVVAAEETPAHGQTTPTAVLTPGPVLPSTAPIPEPPMPPAVATSPSPPLVSTPPPVSALPPPNATPPPASAASPVTDPPPASTGPDGPVAAPARTGADAALPSVPPTVAAPRPPQEAERPVVPLALVAIAFWLAAVSRTATSYLTRATNENRGEGR